jgi:pilus assembly protein Flp/PilA
MQTLIARFVDDDSGATAIEYGLIAALLSVVVIAVLAAIGTELQKAYLSINKELVKANK